VLAAFIRESDAEITMSVIEPAVSVFTVSPVVFLSTAEPSLREVKTWKEPVS
jgi:hypothetical protein